MRDEPNDGVDELGRAGRTIDRSGLPQAGAEQRLAGELLQAIHGAANVVGRVTEVGAQGDEYLWRVTCHRTEDALESA
jgi:hypothetical protein